MKCNGCQAEFVVSPLGESQSEDCTACGLPFHWKNVRRRETLCIQPKHMSRWQSANPTPP